MVIEGARAVQSWRPGAWSCCAGVLPLQPGPKDAVGMPEGVKNEDTKARITMSTLGFSQRVRRSSICVSGLAP